MDSNSILLTSFHAMRLKPSIQPTLGALRFNFLAVTKLISKIVLREKWRAVLNDLKPCTNRIE